MADEPNRTIKRRLRPGQPTIRQQAESAQSAKPKTGRRRIRQVRSETATDDRRISGPLRKLGRPLRGLAIITGLRYLARSWAELRQVAWPNRRQTRQLTIAVIVFSTVFGIIIAVVDYGLGKLFKVLFTK